VLMVLQFAGAQESPPEVAKRPRMQVYASEFAAGFGGFVVAGVGGAALFMYYLLPFATSRPVVVATPALVVAPAAGGLLVGQIGRNLHERGSELLAVVGAYAGLVPGAAIGYAGYRVTNGYANAWLAVPFCAAAVVCVAGGATFAYNSALPMTQATGFLDQRLEPPGMTFTSRELPDRSVEYGVRVQLAGLRF
jgi:hypothetical protein